MPNDDEGLGGRLALLDPGQIVGSQKSLFDRLRSTMIPWADSAGFRSRTQDGRLIGPFNVLLYSPAIGDSFLDLQLSEGEHTTLSERVRQVVILTVGSVWQAPYELYAHAAVSRKAGLAATVIELLVRGEVSNDLSQEEGVAQQFTLQLARTHRVDEKVYQSALTAFGQQGILDMILLAGCYHTVCSLLNAFDVPVPKESDARPAS